VPVEAGGAAVPLAAGTPGVAPPLQAEMSMTTATGRVRKRGNLAIGLLLLADGGGCPTSLPRPVYPVRRFPHDVGQLCPAIAG